LSARSLALRIPASLIGHPAPLKAGAPKVEFDFELNFSPLTGSGVTPKTLDTESNSILRRDKCGACARRVEHASHERASARARERTNARTHERIDSANSAAYSCLP